ncbi:YceH family protein [Planctobacterium marinum]|uniref:YceH family protein n=1 Tax=Planctobacterium marinum TaxID=1631968 RepID=UPI001E29D91E|nr:YceH family protein [Planctobacterium marinum]MCC2604043.1 YceH family protein [Planctobacterium marinum]
MIKLNDIEARIIGVLLEKEITTPEQYPLSLNGLTVGCNQKSNREPVMTLSETDVQSGLDSLASKRQIMEDTWGSRVTKYKHKFCNTEFGSYKFTAQQTAIVCLLLLRGPQTPGELRTRSNRLAEFSNVDEVESALQSLMDFNQDQLVQRLPREPGKRESRYAHCFAEQEQTPQLIDACEDVIADEDDLLSRVIKLEEQVRDLTDQLAKLNRVNDTI